jgi:hypothetical protein
VTASERGKDARRYAVARLWHEFRREYADATYTRIGQRAVQLWIAGTFFMLTNVVLTVLALINTLS